MEQLRLDFLHILKHALLGLKLSSFEELSPDQWNKLEELAEAHKVLPLLFDTVALLPQLQGTEILERLRRHLHANKAHIHCYVKQTKKHWFNA